MKYDARAYHFNMDTDCVELLLRDGRKISIEDISSFCGLNRSYFSKVFRDTMGESPQGVPAALPHGTGGTAAD